MSKLQNNFTYVLFAWILKLYLFALKNSKMSSLLESNSPFKQTSVASFSSSETNNLKESSKTLLDTHSSPSKHETINAIDKLGCNLQSVEDLAPF